MTKRKSAGKPARRTDMDIRVGNFVFHEEDGHVKVEDVAGAMSARVSKYIAKGQFLVMAMDECAGDDGLRNYLQNIAATTFNFLSCVPDYEFMREVNEAVGRCLDRHKDIYGIKEVVDAEEDAKDLQDVKETQESIGKLSEQIEKEGEDAAE